MAVPLPLLSQDVSWLPAPTGFGQGAPASLDKEEWRLGGEMALQKEDESCTE